MKKHARIIAFTVMLSMLLTSLLSCDKASFGNDGQSETTIAEASGTGSDTADNSADMELVRRIEDSTSKHYDGNLWQKSVINQKIEGTMTGNFATVEYTANILHVDISGNSENIQTLMIQDVENKTTTATDSTVKEYTVTKAYSDGYMYYGYKGGDKSIFLKSVLTSADYLPYYQEYDSGIEEPVYREACESVTVRLSDDEKTYIVTYEQSRKSESEEINVIANRLTESFGAEFDLISFTYEVVADAETLVITSSKTTVKSIYAEGDDELLHTYTMEATLSLPEEGFSTKPENADSYALSGDLRYMEIASQKISDIVTSDNIGFTFTSTSTQGAGSTVNLTVSESTKINSGIKNGVYVHHITQSIKSGSTKKTNVYTFNGTQQRIKIEGNAETIVNDMTEVGARTYISAFIGNIDFTPSDIVSINVETTEKGYAYVDFLFRFDLSLYDFLFESLGTKARFGYEKIRFSFDNTGRLMNASYEFYVDTFCNGRSYYIKTEEKISGFGDADLSAITPIRPGSADI